VDYFSIQSGSEVKSCSYQPGLTDVSLVCQSGVCEHDDINGVSKCVESAVSTHDLPISCYSSDDCEYAVGGYYYHNDCDCGFNPTGTAYCPSLMGDTPGLNYI
jgi:hypothetical protein